jgi:hypothetical protein
VVSKGKKVEPPRDQYPKLIDVLGMPQRQRNVGRTATLQS